MIAQQDYFLKPNEDVNAYNARVASMRDGVSVVNKNPTIAPTTQPPQNLGGLYDRVGIQQGSPVNVQSILGNVQNYFSQRNARLEEMQKAMMPSESELATQKELADVRARAGDIKSSYEAGVAKEEDRLAPMEVITGRQASLARQANVSLSTIARQEEAATARLALEQGNRQMKLEAARFLYDATKNELNDVIELYKMTAPENIGTKVNEETGELFVVSRNPLTGEVSTQVAGNVGVTKKFVAQDIIKDEATGQYVFVGIDKDGKVTKSPIGVSGGAVGGGGVDLAQRTKLVALAKDGDPWAIEQLGFDPNNLPGNIVQTLDKMTIEQEQLSSSLRNIDTIFEKSYGMSVVVGPHILGRYAGASGTRAVIGYSQSADFKNAVQYIIKNLTLDKLAEAKSRGITFGALSEQEMNTVGMAASNISSMVRKDKDGNITKLVGSEEEFIKEIKSIQQVLQMKKNSLGKDILSQQEQLEIINIR